MSGEKMARVRLPRIGGARNGGDRNGGDRNGGDSGETAVRQFCQHMVADTAARETAARSCSDEELRLRREQYRERLQAGEDIRGLLPEAFATVREAARRAIGQRHHDVQIMGGAALHLGAIVEMRTGEGKTLTVPLAAYAAALGGEPVHVMTANDYLATRDRDWMRPVYEFLGLTTGLLEPAASPSLRERQAQYRADVTYGPADEFCYDFLRDHIVRKPAELSQRGLGVAIVDEADLVLIDAMRQERGLTSSTGEKEDRYEAVARAVAALRPGADFTVEPAGRSAILTENGLTAVEQGLGLDTLYDPANGGLADLVENAVLARAFERDRDYLVADGHITQIDQQSGRPSSAGFPERLHAALSAKEGLRVPPPCQVVGAIRQRDYLRQYRQLTGMTGTALSDAPIYRDLYGLDVTVIPTNRPVIRVDRPDVLYRTRQAKLAALADDAKSRAAAGQPVLIGAMSATDADAVAALLNAAGTTCEILAARNFEREARVLAEAGRPGTVTIVVKMAGRGVDIVLGGPGGAHDAVADAGGLCVLGTERTGDRRTELHLRGRAGRQGDPGESLFYLSAEDEVAAGMLRPTPKGLLTDGASFGMLSRQLDRTQFNLAESQAQWYRANSEFDDVRDAQQRAFYAERTSVLLEPAMRRRIESILADVVTAEVDDALGAGAGPGQLASQLHELCQVGDARGSIFGAMREGNPDRAANTVAVVLDAASRIYDEREARYGAATWEQAARVVVLNTFDRAWGKHLQDMTDLQTELIIRGAYGPQALGEFQRRGRDLYADMVAGVKRDAINRLFKIEINLKGNWS
jgi:preprotein translocase subunit SecA